MRLGWLVWALAGFACTAETGTLGLGDSDAGTTPDAGVAVDAGSRDGGADLLDVLADFECLSINEATRDVVHVDPFTGALVATGVGAPVDHPTSLAWVDGFVAACAPSGSDPNLYIVDLGTGEQTTTALSEPCSALAASSRGWVVQTSPARDIHLYDDIVAARSGRARTTRSMFVSRLGAFEDRIYGAWHAADHLEVTTFDDPTVTELALEGHDGWIHGIAPFPGGLLLIVGLRDPELRVYEEGSGRELHRAAVDGSTPLAGLACRRRP